MTVQRSPAALLSEIRARVRRELGDPSTDPSGTAISIQLLTWQDTDIDAAINDQLIEMGTIKRLQLPGDALLYADLTLTDDTNSPGIDLPAGVGSGAIYKVTDPTASNSSQNKPQKLALVSADEIENYGAPDLSTVDYGFTYYALKASSTGAQIIVRPLRVGHTIRVWYIAPPVTVSDAADTVIFSEVWREFIALGAAYRLLSINDEAPSQLFIKYQYQASLFKTACNRAIDTQRVKKVAGLFRW